MGPPARRSSNARKLLLAIVGAPLAAAALLLLGEALCRVLTPAGSEHAPLCYFDVRDDGEQPAALVPSGRPPFPNARFWPAAIPLAAPPATARVLCLGDSTVHGHPFEPPAAFADWLAVRLPRLLPERRFEVWNLGCNAMSSEAVLDLARETTRLRPDLVVVYVGHNEFLDVWLDAVLTPVSHSVGRVLARSWLGRRVASFLPEPKPAAPAAGAPRRGAGAIVDEPRLNPAARARGLRRYRDHLEAIVGTVREAGAVALLCLPVCDLVDTPPELSTFAAATPAAIRDEYRERLGRVRERRLALEHASRAANGSDTAADAATADPELAAAAHALLAECDALAAIDATVAALAYERGRLHRLLGDAAAARAAFIDARDRDAEPIRATAEQLAILREVADASGALLADPWPAFAAAAADRLGLAGQDGLFVDYVHPDLAGHRLLAGAMLHALAEGGVFAPRAQWRFDAEPDLATYEQTMGFSRARQADSLARRGLFALGQGQLDPGAGAPLKAAEQLFAMALSIEPDCALAHAGRGALALVRGDGGAALAELDRAHALDPASVTLFVENYEKLPVVRELFERGGLTLKDGRFVRK